MSGESLGEVGFIRHERLQKSPTAVDRNQLGIERKETGKKFNSHMLMGLSRKAKRRGLFQKLPRLLSMNVRVFVSCSDPRREN